MSALATDVAAAPRIDQAPAARPKLHRTQATTQPESETRLWSAAAVATSASEPESEQDLSPAPDSLEIVVLTVQLAPSFLDQGVEVVRAPTLNLTCLVWIDLMRRRVPVRHEEGQDVPGVDLELLATRHARISHRAIACVT